MGEGAFDPVFTARTLLRAGRVATLATQSGGYPFAGLVTPATAGDLSVLLLLSDLSEHTKQLRRDPRCAVLVAGPAPAGNPQTTPRVTAAGSAVITDEPVLRERFLAVHPYAALYAGFGDFHLWRIVPEEALLVAGFAQAHKLPAARLLPDPAAVAALDAAAPGIMAHCNVDHADTMAELAGQPGAWRMVGVDCDGCDLAGEAEAPALRLAWPQPVADADGVRRALILLARAGRRQL
jgi:putative heme iron utilization protein